MMYDAIKFRARPFLRKHVMLSIDTSVLYSLFRVGALTLTLSTPVSAATYAGWLNQIYMTDAVMKASGGGYGQIIGVVDSGIAPNSVFAPGQVSLTKSGCAAVSGGCTQGYADEGGHGTAVASIAAAYMASPASYYTGAYQVRQGAVIGVAPNANIVAEKIFGASGTATSADVANGIRRAVDAGANVVNLSLSYVTTPDVVQAINYAASKGATLVWAGGNEGQPLVGNGSTYGLTPQAIQQLLFVGSVSSSNSLSTFSNTPGSGTLNGTSAYAQRWLVAPGEKILAPLVQSNGTIAWAAWTGTSMATPTVSGAVALLQTAWPILKTNRSAANLLLATSIDLGAPGVDKTYGVGLMNLTWAFEPFGPLWVQTNKGSVQLMSLSGSMITSGALGSFSAVKTRLASYTVFDSFNRNFTANLSGLVQAAKKPVVLNPVTPKSYAKPVKLRLADGGELMLMSGATRDPLDSLGALEANTEEFAQQRNGLLMLTNANGSVTAVGAGFSSQYAYAKALQGDDAFAALSSEQEVLGMSSLARGGNMLAYGTSVGKARVAVAYSSGTPAATGPFGSTSSMAGGRANLSVGVSYQATPVLQTGATLSMLNEQQGLLGASYASGGPLGLGESNKTTSLGLTLGWKLSPTSRLLLESTFASTKASEGAGLLTGTAGIRAEAYGAAYLHDNWVKEGDRLMVSLKQPLRVVAGTVGMVTADVDKDTGVPIFGVTSVGLAPAAREVEYRLSYVLPMNKTQSVSLQGGYRHDAYNIAGYSEYALGVSFTSRF